MKLREAAIKNFRGLRDVKLKCPSDVAVIVGPNAIGKSSLLEALRLSKAILMPAYPAEAQQVLQSLNAWIPHTMQMIGPALLGDATKRLDITLELELTDREFTLVAANLPQLAQLHVRHTLALPGGESDLALVQFLSSEEGRTAHANALKHVQDAWGSGLRTIHPQLIIDPRQGVTSGSDLFAQEVAMLLARLNPVEHPLFSYFPADRAMPSGDVAIQLGTAEAAAQMYSHMGQPATKYSRLKQYIVNQIVAGHRDQLIDDFNVVFGTLLAGKEFAGIGITQTGALSVAIRDTSSRAVYDIDFMSSGEKGLLLTFFLMKRTGSESILLVDEPELHLNPAVCRKLLQFMVEEVAQPVGSQIILCTHSPELLGAAYDRQDCTLFHLRSSDDLSPVYPRDRGEVFEALKRLGAQTNDVLFARGNVYVEGDHDVDILEAGFSERVAGFKLTPLTGRAEVEKAIATFKTAEGRGDLDTIQAFIFDLDYSPSNLARRNSARIRVAQWDRYCLENYLLDSDAVYDACKAIRTTNCPESRAATENWLKTIALTQLTGVVAREAYKDLEPPNAGMRHADASAADYTTIADRLAHRIQDVCTATKGFDDAAWRREFVTRCQELDRIRRTEWESEWLRLCNGKLVLEEFHRRIGPGISSKEFKKRIVEALARSRGEGWRVADQILARALGTS